MTRAALESAKVCSIAPAFSYGAIALESRSARPQTGASARRRWTVLNEFANRMHKSRPDPSGAEIMSAE